MLFPFIPYGLDCLLNWCNTQEKIVGWSIVVLMVLAIVWVVVDLKRQN